MVDAAEKARLLSILEGHGQSFLNSFPSLGESSKKRKGNTIETAHNKKARREEEGEEGQEEEAEEWFGIGQDAEREDSEDERESGDDFEHTDDEFTHDKTESNVVVFTDPSANKSAERDDISRVQMKAFMSSKISKVSSNAQDPVIAKKNKVDEEEDKTNAQNDALLHKLVHTKLLSGSLDPNLDLTPAQRRKALAGRVLELTGAAKMGKGERQVRDGEKRKASKHVREGLSLKQKERGKHELEEAKNLGNYHPTLKKVFEASPGPTTRKREKGLKMGVGKFSNGSLRLSRDDVKMAEGGFGGGSSRGSRGRGRGRGRGSGGKRR